MSVLKQYDPEGDSGYSHIDIMTDNKIVTARGSHLDFHRGSDVTPGYTAQFKDNTPIKASNLMLYGGNRNILMLTPQKRNVLVRLDTETGKNLGELELSFHSELPEPYDSIVPVKKFSQLHAQDTISIAGTSNNHIFNLDWDTRAPVDQVVLGDTRVYTKQGKYHKFTSLATTSQGEMVVGDNEGVVRLFGSPNPKNGEIKRSKTNLNQLADPVKSVEVSSTGEWVVWTTKEYLAVVNTEFNDAKSGERVSGFQRPMGDARPDALILRIPTEDCKKYGITEIDFTAARFDNGPFRDPCGPIIEEFLVVSTGPFVIQWNFRRVKIAYGKPRNSPDAIVRPSIHKKSGVVVDKVFEYGKSRIVTATENDLDELELDGMDIDINN